MDFGGYARDGILHNPMCIQAHVLSIWIIMDIVICATNNFGIDRRRKARLGLQDDVCHWLCIYEPATYVAWDRRLRTATARGVPFEADPIDGLDQGSCSRGRMDRSQWALTHADWRIDWHLDVDLD